jgi:NAD(P)-dependent dehydrogenase (short-subunit alcohol dehydrogenase family)
MTTTANHPQPVAIITGASRGLGRALAGALHGGGWQLVVDGRDDATLVTAAASWPGAVVIAGDITDPKHRAALTSAAGAFGRIDLLVNNASELGPSPLPELARYGLDSLRQVIETNVVAALATIALALPRLRSSAGVVLNVSSDAAVEAYRGWGGYGASKAALDQLSAVLAVEEPALRVYAVDPGDMRTEMHQRAFPGEDISDRPQPGEVVPALLRLLAARPASGRYRAAAWADEPIAEGRPS